MKNKNRSTRKVFSATFLTAVAVLSLPHSARADSYHSGWNTSFTNTTIDSPRALQRAMDENSAQKSFTFGQTRIGSDEGNESDAVADTLMKAVQNAGFSTAVVNSYNNEQFADSSMKGRVAGINALKDIIPDTHGGAISYTLKPQGDWTFSLSSAFLKEKNVMLESANNKYFGMSKTSTFSFGVDAKVRLGSGYKLGINAVAASTTGSPGPESLITDTTRLSSFGFGMTLDKNNTSFSIEKPLRVYAGSAHADMPGVDSNGNQIVQNTKISMAPSGSETDFGVSYNKPFSFGGTGVFTVAFRHDADNISGAEDGVAMFRYKAAF